MILNCIHPTSRNRSSLLLALGTAGALAAFTTGCSMTSTPSGPVTLAGAALRGSIHGGQQPVGGATIQLYAAGTTGYGSAARPLIGTTVLSNADGTFAITGKYTCQSTDLLYLVGTGGNPGVTGTQNNSALALMAGIGPCSGLSGSSVLQVNELTTVASVWALSPFMTSLTHVGTSATNGQGLINAFAAINNLVNLATGATPGASLPAGATLPIAEINTLGDILATCVNTVDTTAPAAKSSACMTLFTTTTASTTPSDTVQAALNLAQNPTLGLASLTASVTGNPPFQPTLGSTPPTSWTIAINYIGGGISAPAGIAADASGNIWTANGNSSVTKLTSTGAPLSGTAGFTVGSLNAPSAIAIDTAGNAWVANSGNSSVSKIASSGASGTPYSSVGGLNIPKGIAIDAAGNVWVANSGNATLTELSSAGAAISGASGFSVGGTLSSPTALAIDPH